MRVEQRQLASAAVFIVSFEFGAALQLIAFLAEDRRDNSPQVAAENLQAACSCVRSASKTFESSVE
jgi:hypothetical protein